MNKVFYPRIAMINLRNNGRTYVPYLLTCILSTAMFYVICSLSLNPDLDTMLGGGYMRTLLQMGTWIVGFFVIIFLFYTNSFLMKRRKKEFGVFNILGMEKRHISKVIAYETLFTALVSLLAGISAAGASIVTINQSTPENGAALVAVTIRTDTMQMSPEELTEKLSRQRMVVSVRCGYNL